VLLLGSLVRGIAHEIGNSIHAVTVITDHVLRSFGSDPNHRNLGEELGQLRGIAAQVDRIDRVLREIKEFAEPAADRIEPTSLNGAIEAALGLARFDLHFRRFRVTTRLDRALPAVRGVASQLTQLAVHVLIGVARGLDPTGDELEVATRREGESAVVGLRAVGPGASREALQKVLDRGPDLAVAEAIVERHGGSLRVCAGAEQDASVRVRIPILDASGTGAR
jgi:C4-dicarboxylate-specific signal transduction histidine kinase